MCFMYLICIWYVYYVLIFLFILAWSMYFCISDGHLVNLWCFRSLPGSNPESTSGSKSPAQHIVLGGHPAAMVNKTALIVSFLAVITLGGVTNKFAYQIKDVGDPAYPPHFFKKPWFLELLMFIGMTLSFPLHWAVQSFSKPKVADGTQSEPLLPEEARLE